MIRLYNSLTKKKESLETIEPGRVKMYVCGPTTYNYIHLGNARPVVVFDTIRRYLKYRGYQVVYVQNFTDVDDKIIKRAHELGEPALELASRFIKEYFKDADALNVGRADIHPRVSDHIEDIIEMVKKLIDRGFAYEVDGDIYFNVRKFQSYGQLSGRSLDELMAGARVQVDERKNDPLDFALWKKAKEGEPAWSSPWGEGRPGWHIECSVMSLKYLGKDFDIHGGGHDLIFPHHENELAQSQACSRCGFAKYWLHNGFITINQEKMSKSLGNFFLVREILDKFPPDAVRFYLLATHYRSPLDFDDEKLVVAGKGLDRLKNFRTALLDIVHGPAVPDDNSTPGEDLRKIEAFVENLEQKFTEAMDDDFNTALAIACLFDFVRDINGIINKPDFKVTQQAVFSLKKALNLYDELGNGVLGLFFRTGKQDALPGSDELVSSLMDILLSIRQEARDQKQWALSDKIRDAVKELGIILEDGPKGTKWKIVDKD